MEYKIKLEHVFKDIDFKRAEEILKDITYAYLDKIKEYKDIDKISVFGISKTESCDGREESWRHGEAIEPSEQILIQIDTEFHQTGQIIKIKNGVFKYEKD